MRLFSLVYMMFLFTPPITALASEAEDTIIEKVVAAYGGETLTDLKSYTISDQYINVSFGQDHTPNLTELNDSRQVLRMDLENNRAVYDTWFEGRGGNNQNTVISDGETAHTLNFQNNTYAPANNADPYVFAGGSMRTADVILAYQLSKSADEATLGEDTYFKSRPHHVITIPFPQSPAVNLYIDAESFLISKMVRENPQFGNLDYIFSDYKVADGITYASRINFYINGQPSAISRQHELAFNDTFAADLFVLPEDFSEQGDAIDTTDMRANKLAEGVYHVGQGNAYSLFIITDQGIVSAGAYGGLRDRFAFFQKSANNYSPLAYQIINHHHTDHLGGVDEALALGARLITVEENVAAIKDAIESSTSQRDFLTIGEQAVIGQGANRVQLFDVSTIHAESFLVAYVPKVKTIFIADHYGTPLAKALPIINQGGLDMFAELKRLNIAIKQISTEHSPRLFTFAEMQQSADAYTPVVCAGNRPVCL